VYSWFRNACLSVALASCATRTATQAREPNITIRNAGSSLITSGTFGQDHKTYCWTSSLEFLHGRLIIGEFIVPPNLRTIFHKYSRLVECQLIEQLVPTSSFLSLQPTPLYALHLLSHRHTRHQHPQISPRKSRSSRLFCTRLRLMSCRCLSCRWAEGWIPRGIALPVTIQGCEQWCW
jgi:hypothetical protein